MRSYRYSLRGNAKAKRVAIIEIPGVLYDISNTRIRKINELGRFCLYTNLAPGEIRFRRIAYTNDPGRIMLTTLISCYT